MLGDMREEQFLELGMIYSTGRMESVRAQVIHIAAMSGFRERQTRIMMGHGPLTSWSS
jgi:hypothetical protein